MNGPFDLDRIRTETFVRQIEFRTELPSTNDLALQRARQRDVNLPLLVLAQRQTHGRGRGAHRWWSPDGSLAFSLVVELRTTAAPRRRPKVSLTAGLAVCHTLRQLRADLPVGLKWPNDVYVQSRKICGILVEAPAEPKGRTVVGVGLNVNNAFDRAADDTVVSELRTRATSLCDATGHRFDLNHVLIRLLDALAAEFQRLSTDPRSLPARWQPFCMLRGTMVRVRQASRQIRGICQGIDVDGALVVSTERGVERCFSGEIAET